MKIKFGILVAAASGKIAGNVASRNRGGAYLRTWAKPLNPQTTYQQTVRARLGTLSAAWRNLTDSQRESWSAWALGNPVIDRLGEQVILSGQQAYVQVNTNRLIAGDAAVASTTPSAASFTSLILDTATPLAISIATNGVTLALGTGAAADQIILIYVSPIVSAGINNTGAVNRLLVAHTISAAEVTAGVIDVGSLYEARFGDLTGNTGRRINLRVREYDEGQRSSPDGITGLVAA
jgi:hypothetical protein